MDLGFFLVPGSKYSSFGVANFERKIWMRISGRDYLSFRTLFGYPLRPVESIRIGDLGPLSTQECKHAGVHLRRDYVIGKTAQEFSELPGLIRTVMPVVKGHVRDWETMYRIMFDAWEAVEPYKPLSFRDFTLVVGEPCDAEPKEREEMTSFVFEVMEVKSLCAASRAFFRYASRAGSDSCVPQDRCECLDDSGKWKCTFQMGHTSSVVWEDEKRSVQQEVAEKERVVEKDRADVMRDAFECLCRKQLRSALTITREQYLEYGPVAIRYVGI